MAVKSKKVVSDHYTIWSNYNYDEKYYLDYIEEMSDNFSELSQTDIEKITNDLIWDELEVIKDEFGDRYKYDNGIIVIADLGLWHGRKPGYNKYRLSSISDCLCLNNGDFGEFWVDYNGDLRAYEAHHDGTNYYLYRAWKPDVSDEQKETLKAKILNNTFTRKDITRLTERIGDVIARAYSFNIRNVNRKGTSCTVC